jgi:hypothetical protein
MTTLRTVTALAVLAWAAPALADAPVPTCSGHKPAAAATARAEGLRHYRLSKREGPTDAEMATALGFFEAACAAGDDTALELRAYALAGVERFVEAAQTLDAFLATHPVESLSEDTRARVAAQQPEILSRVASLTVETASPGASVTINHRVVGTTPLRQLRLAPGRYDLEVTADGLGTKTRSVDLAAGEHTESFIPPAPAPVAKPAVATDAHAASASSDSSPASLAPWALGTGIGAVVLLGAGVGGAVWANERSNTYNNANCATTNAAGCSSTLSQYHAGRGLEVAGFIGGGLAAVASGILFYLDRQRAHASSSGIGVGPVSCTVPGAGLVCAGTF